MQIGPELRVKLQILCFSLFLAEYSRYWYWTRNNGDMPWYGVWHDGLTLES